MANVQFITANSNGKYQIIDQSTGVGGAGYLQKRIIVTAADNTVLYDQLTSYTETLIELTVDSQWVNHLALVQISINFIYLYDSVQSVFLLPTTLNIRQ